MSVRGDGPSYAGTHIRFNYLRDTISGKTKIWNVISLSGDDLGEIKWFSKWRKYCFFPISYTVFEETCLTEIIEFITDRTKEHRSQ